MLERIITLDGGRGVSQLLTWLTSSELSVDVSRAGEKRMIFSEVDEFINTRTLQIQRPSFRHNDWHCFDSKLITVIRGPICLARQWSMVILEYQTDRMEMILTGEFIFSLTSTLPKQLCWLESPMKTHLHQIDVSVLPFEERREVPKKSTSPASDLSRPVMLDSFLQPSNAEFWSEELDLGASVHWVQLCSLSWKERSHVSL